MSEQGDWNRENANEVIRLEAEVERLAKSLKAKGVACLKHDLVGGWSCPRCLDDALAEVERLKLYESEHERLKKELNTILHPNGDGPKAPSFCDLVAYVQGDKCKLENARKGLKLITCTDRHLAWSIAEECMEAIEESEVKGGTETNPKA